MLNQIFKMKSNYITSCIALVLLLLISNNISSQEFQGKAYYFSKTTMDMSNFGGGRQLNEQQKKQIAERLKSVLEKNYILIFNQIESIYKEEEVLAAPNQGRGMRFGMMSSSGGNQYKNLKDHQFLQENEFYGKQFLINDSLPKLNWKLGSENKMIGQYMCFKATAIKDADGFDFASFRRRSNNEKPKDSTTVNTEKDKDITKKIMVTAWYTPQIPVNQGPDMYWGLPGLILEVNVDRTTILCSKIILNPSEKDEMKVPSKGKEVTKKEYDIIVKAKMEEMRDMFRNRGGRGHD